MKKSIFITGSEGFIASHIIEKFVDKGYKIYALILYNSFGDIGNLKFIPKNKLKKIEVIFGDLRDTGTYEKYISKVDYVLNLASLISIPYSYIAQKSYFDNNILGASSLFDVCKKHNLKKIVHFSTSEIYGTPKKIPINENTSLNPQSPYAASKLAVDHIAKSYFYSFGMPIVILRPFNNFGPRQSRRAVIPEIICQSLKNNTIYLGDTSTKRDFLYVEDTAEAVLKVLNSKNILGEEINIGSNQFFRIIDVVRKVSKILNKNIEVKIDTKKLRPRKSEVKVLLCDFSKAKKILKWQPTACNTEKKFNTKLSETIIHYDKFFEFYDKNFYR